MAGRTYAWSGWLILLAGLACGAGRCESQQAYPENWPTNPYWVHSPPPNGPGHKLAKYEELLKSVPKERIGIKVNRPADMGTFVVSEVMRFHVCGGDKEGRLAINNKGQHSHGLDQATLEWRDERGEQVLETRAITGECG